MSARFLAPIAAIILTSSNYALAQDSASGQAQSNRTLAQSNIDTQTQSSELSAEEAALRHKALMRAHRKRIIETGRNDHAPTPEEYSPELELYKKQVPATSRINHANQATQSNPASANHFSGAGRSAYSSTAEPQVELRTDIRLETEKPGPAHPPGSEQFVSKRMHSESSTKPLTTLGQSQPIDFKPYLSELGKKIKKNWSPPARQDRTEVSVNFLVLPDGSVANLKITKHGSPTADQAARQAILRAAPFAQFPPGVTAGKQIDYDFSHSSHADEPSFQWGIH